MRILTTTLLLLMSFFVSAQTYDVTYVLSKTARVDKSLSPEMNKLIIEAFAKNKRVFQLHYVNGKSKYYLDYVLCEGKLDPDPRKMTGYGLVYKDFKKGYYINVGEGIGENIAVKEEFDDMFNWQIDESKDTIIAGYLCKRATTMYAGNELVAWFSRSIPIMDGPLKFAGLPGLILQVETGIGVTEMTAIKISKSSKEEIIIPVMEKYISFEEFKESVFLTVKGKRIKKKKTKP